MAGIHYTTELTWNDCECCPSDYDGCNVSCKLMTYRSFYSKPKRNRITVIKYVMLTTLLLTLVGAVFSYNAPFITKDKLNRGMNFNWPSILDTNLETAGSSSDIQISSVPRKQRLLAADTMEEDHFHNENHSNVKDNNYQMQAERCNKCHHFIYKTVIQNNVCDKLGDIEYLILVESEPKSIENRLAIRETWGQFSWKNTASVRILFVLDSKIYMKEQTLLQRENAIHHDILQLEAVGKFNETITNLAMFDYVEKYCPRAKFVIKSSDNNYLNFKHIKSFTEEYKFECLTGMVGYCHSFSAPNKYISTKMKLLMAFRDWKQLVYPRHCVGSLFMLQGKIMKAILDEALNVLPIIDSDAYLGILMDSLRIVRFNSKAFMLMAPPDINMSKDQCSGPRFWPGIHKVSPDMMRKIWNTCQDKLDFSL